MKKIIVFIMSIFTSVAVMAQHEVNCTFTSITSNITTNTTLSSSTLYRIEGCIHVTNGHTLTIPAGTKVMFKKGSASSLTIDEGASIAINGNSGSPVRFTSDQTPGNQGYGDWDGLIIAGKAKNNVSGGTISLSGRTCTSVSGGGTSDADNSGTIEYLLLDYATTGITFVSVGSGTTVDHIQVAYSSIDGYDFLGGDVNAKDLISYNAKGNDFVFTDGNRSLIQFALSVRLDVSNAHLSSGSNGFVITNDATGSSNTPLTYPIISDATFIGPLYCGATGISGDYKNAVLFDHNANGGVYNSFVAGWPTGLLVNDASSLNNLNNNSTLNFAENSFSSNTTDYNNGTSWPSGCATSMMDWITNGEFACAQPGNQFPTYTTGYSATICGTYSSTPPSFQLSGTTGLSASNYTDMPDLDGNAFFTTGTRKHGGFYTSAGSDWTTFGDWNPSALNPCPGERMSNPTAVNNVIAENITGLQLAPNPSNGITYANFNAAADGNITISVVDNAGRILRTTQSNIAKGNQHIAVDTKGLAAGIYIIKVQSSNSLMHAQLVVE